MPKQQLTVQRFINTGGINRQILEQAYVNNDFQISEGIVTIGSPLVRLPKVLFVELSMQDEIIGNFYTDTFTLHTEKVSARVTTEDGYLLFHR